MFTTRRGKEVAHHSNVRIAVDKISEYGHFLLQVVGPDIPHSIHGRLGRDSLDLNAGLVIDIEEAASLLLGLTAPLFTPFHLTRHF